MKIVLFNTLLIRGNRCAFHSDMMLLDCLCCCPCYFVAGLVSLWQSQIVILHVQVNERCQQVVFDDLPKYTCHFVAVHLYDGVCHFNLAHCEKLPSEFIFVVCIS